MNYAVRHSLGKLFTLMSGEGLRHTDVGVKMNPDQKTIAKHDNIIYTAYRKYLTIKVIVFEFKLQGTSDQYGRLDEALRTGRFVRNSIIRAWMDGIVIVTPPCNDGACDDRIPRSKVAMMLMLIAKS